MLISDSSFYWSDLFISGDRLADHRRSSLVLLSCPADHGGKKWRYRHRPASSSLQDDRHRLAPPRRVRAISTASGAVIRQDGAIDPTSRTMASAHLLHRTLAISRLVMPGWRIRISVEPPNAMPVMAAFM
jgi:hypothetical protein